MKLYQGDRYQKLKIHQNQLTLHNSAHNPPTLVQVNYVNNLYILYDIYGFTLIRVTVLFINFMHIYSLTRTRKVGTNIHLKAILQKYTYYFVICHLAGSSGTASYNLLQLPVPSLLVTQIFLHHNAYMYKVYSINEQYS
jgi:hypothetical protein